MTSRCHSTESFLKEHLGRANVITIPIDDNFIYTMGGGLRCMSNYICFDNYVADVPDTRKTQLEVDGITAFFHRSDVYHHQQIQVF